MRILLGGTGLAPVEGQELPAGAYPWPSDRPWTRVTMLRTLDGGVAGADGRSGSVSSALDREVLAEVRRLADAVVIGASTLRTERYGPMRIREDAVDERRRLGLADAPVLVIVSAGLDLPWEEPLFRESAVAPIVATGTTPSPEALERAAQHTTLLRLGAEQVSARALVAALRDRALTRIVCEGGPGLLAGFAREDVVDEVCLTVAPSQPAVTPGAAGVVQPHGFELVQVLEHESFLFLRYVRSAVETRQ